MPDSPNKLPQFWQELKRRRVIHVIIVYATAAFVIIELVNNVYEPLRLPEWTPTLVIIILLVGFPLAIIFSWIFDVTPEGIEKTKPAHKLSKEEKPVSSRGWKIATYVSVVIIIGLIGLNLLSNYRTSRNIQKLEKTIAVLPFEIWNSDEEFKHYLGGAIANEINTQLAKINEFHVFSYTSSSKFKGPNKPSIPQIGKELGANFIIEGSVERQNEDVSIQVQVIQANIDAHIWAHEFKDKWENIFSIRAEIAVRIAEELKIVLSKEEVERIEIVPTENTEAYNLYLQGRHFWIQEGRDNLDKSIAYYKRALEIDPNFALAYVGMAITYTSYGWYGYLPKRDVIPLAKEAAMKALEIDNTLGEAHTELAFAQLIFDWDWPGSEKEFKRALELNPNNARAHNLYAWLLTVVGRLDEAIEQSKRAHELDPLSLEIWVELGRRYYYARDYDKAIEEYRKVLELFPNNKFSSVSWYARSHLALALSQKGMHNEAIEEYSKTDYEHTWYCFLGYAYGVTGKRDNALEILNHYLDLSKKEFVWNANVAIIYIGLGKKDKAFEWLDKAYEQHEAWMILLKVDPIFDSLRSDPRFQDLVDRMNFPDN
jgi:TolB-like protein/Tfp pilus assembly protein PilF